jgi:hypothetical protein
LNRGGQLHAQLASALPPSAQAEGILRKEVLVDKEKETMKIQREAKNARSRAFGSTVLGFGGAQNTKS